MLEDSTLPDDPGAQQPDKPGQPGRMGRPRRSGDQIAVHVGRVHRDIHIRTASASDFRTHRRIRRNAAALHDTGGRQYLRDAFRRAPGVVVKEGRPSKLAK